ncbi:hypothetical protein OG946_06505 [Streptomyces sp. NBC_01808]|uniref:hypothetical protein n=1 Tax=Streptomyces sp. NBC_01808 TaxID=2975947 RepID=UPI002DDAB266|nr:hypothetical protein [Streptomyces sp. NBC_01808]WSA37057.1 hypothetical protein OG946_06505 [Streptomyces sp. NBC_01808]
MTAGNWERAVREQVGLGRLLPLGDAADGTWIAERAAAGVLRRAAAGVREARVTGLRVGLADPGDQVDSEPRGGRADARALGGAEAVGPAPVSALPYGELRISAQCDATVDRPMTATAAALREALLRGAEERLGLRVAAVDVHVAGLLETPQTAAQPVPGGPPDSPPPTARETDRPGHGAPDVPGVVDSDVLPDGDHAEVRVVLDSAHRALDVARAVRTRTDAATVTVLVTEIR